MSVIFSFGLRGSKHILIICSWSPSGHGAEGSDDSTEVIYCSSDSDANDSVKFTEGSDYGGSST